MIIGWRKAYFRYKDYFLNVATVYRKRRDVMMFLEILLTLITISVFSIFALKPTALTIVTLVREIDEKEKVIVKLDTKIANIREAQILYDQERSTIALLETALPKTAAPDKFMRQIEGLTANSQAAILGASIGKVILVGEEKVKRSDGGTVILPPEVGGLPFSLSFNGPFSSLTGILANLENMRRPPQTSAFTLSSSLETIGEDKLFMVISGLSPYYYY